MNKWIIRIIAGVLIIGAFAGVGFAGYRLGLNRGMRLAGSFDDAPRFVERFHKDEMPGFHFWLQRDDRGFHRGVGPGGYHSRGYGLISPLSFLLKAAVIGLIAWGVYKLFTGTGWQLSFTRHPADATTAQPAEKKSKGRQ